MRHLTRFGSVGLAALALTLPLGGCTGGSLEEGVPKTEPGKDYAPTIAMPGMSPKAAKKAASAPKGKPDAAPAPAGESN